MDDVERPARGDEIRRMREMVREALAAGAIGVSTGLYYEPAAAATTEEVIEICRPLAESGGLYCTHMRDEGDRVLDSLEETFRVGREVGVPVVISHHKVVGLPNHGRSHETLPVIAERMKHQTIGLDCYPYCASSTILSAVARGESRRGCWSPGRSRTPSIRGGTSPRWRERWAFRRTRRSSACCPAGAIYFSMDEADVQRILAFERTMVGSDGLPHDAAPHPRLWGTFPRVLGHYARELGLFPLETAVHKMTGLTAQTFGLAGPRRREGRRLRRPHGVRRRHGRRGGDVRAADPAGARHRIGDRQRRGGLARRSADRRAAGQGARAQRSLLTRVWPRFTRTGSQLKAVHRRRPSGSAAAHRCTDARPRNMKRHQ